jgi:glycosyltransferase involved in cell wall biosynthesis
MTKLLYITNGIKGAGGLERVLSIKAGYLAEKMGYEVHIAVLNNNGAEPFYDFSPKITIHDIKVGGNPVKYVRNYIKGIERAVRGIRPDIISVCDDGLKGFFLPLVLQKPCAMIYERHVSKIIQLGANPDLKRRVSVGFKFRLMNFLGRRFDKFVVLTVDNLEEWNLDNLAVISNPLSFYPAGTSDLEGRKVIAVGKQSYQKGYDRLLHVWKKIADRHPDWELNIYGKYDPSQKLVALVEELEISGSVRFYEPVKNIEEKFLESSVFAFTSRFEGFGMVLTEAMACGVPCVSFDCPCGPSDIVMDGTDGFLVNNGDIDAFAEKLLTLIENESLRQEFGKNARVNVRRYLPENIIPQWHELFKSLLK